MPPIDEAEVRRLVREAVERVLGEQATRSARPTAPPPPADSRRVALGSDHGGFSLKEALKRFLVEELGYEVVDCGTHGPEPVDYPDFAAAVAREVAQGRCARGIVVDAAGIGSTMAANKVSGVRCALCHDLATVLNSREHNDANLLALGAKVVNPGMARRLVKEFLATPFAGGRHERRVRKIMELEARSGG
jgi:ribose 5-phosphate isomerase B